MWYQNRKFDRLCSFDRSSDNNKTVSKKLPETVPISALSAVDLPHVSAAINQLLTESSSSGKFVFCFWFPLDGERIECGYYVFLVPLIDFSCYLRISM